MKTNQFELLAPGGDVESVKAAILAGADAVYCGLDKFNARNRAVNISLENLSGLVRLAHQHDCKIFITLNIIILENEIPEVIRLLNKLVNTEIDGVILQDLGLFHIISQHFPTLDVHASTQLNTHNEGQIDFLSTFKASRTNLSRELNINEIKHLAQYGQQRNMAMEVFVHGSYCIGFSGLCYISSARNGNSGNRGRCSQPCRDQYQTTKVGKNFPLNMKDNSAYEDIEILADAGVYSLKVEGRIKKPHYVYTVVDQWRKQIDGFCQTGEILTDKENLYKVFNRDFSNSYLKGHINRNMFIDNPRAHSVEHFSQVYQCESDESVQLLKRKLYHDKTQIIQTLDEKSKQLDIRKLGVSLNFSGQAGEPLKLTMSCDQNTWIFHSHSELQHSDKLHISLEECQEKFKPLNDDTYQITSIGIDGLGTQLFVPFKQLTQLREQAKTALNGGKPKIKAVELPKISKPVTDFKAPQLSVLLSDPKDIERCASTNALLQFQMPAAMKANLKKLVHLFESYPDLTPYFPAVLIGEDFDAAVTWLETVMPKTIITNNTGVAYTAYKLGIEWIAGPLLNLTNSYALKCIEENFAASGGFISNEINYKQMRHIIRPQRTHLKHTQRENEPFRVFYSIYHPITLLTSRQCLFHQTVGCKIKEFDSKCLKNCKKQASIINLNTAHYVIDKQKGDHNSMYSDHNFLNTKILKDLPDLFTDFLIDLRDIQTQTQVQADKPEIIEAFLSLLQQEQDETALNQMIHPTVAAQYHKGL